MIITQKDIDQIRRLKHFEVKIKIKNIQTNATQWKSYLFFSLKLFINRKILREINQIKIEKIMHLVSMQCANAVHI